MTSSCMCKKPSLCYREIFFAWIEEILSYVSLGKNICVYFITIMLVCFGIRSCICMQDLYYLSLERIYSCMWEKIACLVSLHWEIFFGKEDGLHA